MALTVAEIMNEEVAAVRGDETVAEALAGMAALQIEALPVLDHDGRPQQVLDLAALLDGTAAPRARDCRGRPALAIRGETTIAVAAQVMAETGRRHLVVVDDGGRAVGIVSTLDVLRGLVGLPVARSRAFSHFDASAGVCFTDDEPLDAAHARDVPSEPGVLVVVHGGVGRAERVVAARACVDLQAHVTSIIASNYVDAPNLRGALRRGQLRFRTAVLHDAVERQRVAAVVLGRAWSALHAAKPASA